MGLSSKLGMIAPTLSAKNAEKGGALTLVGGAVKGWASPHLKLRFHIAYPHSLSWS
jgi:hypothetical protein